MKLFTSAITTLLLASPAQSPSLLVETPAFTYSNERYVGFNVSAIFNPVAPAGTMAVLVPYNRSVITVNGMRYFQRVTVKKGAVAWVVLDN